MLGRSCCVSEGSPATDGNHVIGAAGGNDAFAVPFVRGESQCPGQLVFHETRRDADVAVMAADMICAEERR